MKVKNPHPSPYALERCITACHDWFHPDDLESMALGAFQMARRSLDEPENWPVCKRGQGRYWMAEEIVRHFELLLFDQAHRRQVPGFTDWASNQLKLIRADTHDRTTDTEIVDNLSTTLSPRRQDIHRRASQNETTEE